MTPCSNIPVSLQASLRLYLKFFMCLHLVALATVFILPKIMRGEKRSQPTSTTSSITTNAASNGNLKTNKGSSSSKLNNNDCNENGLLQQTVEDDSIIIDEEDDGNSSNFSSSNSSSSNSMNNINNSCDKKCTNGIDQNDNGKSLNDTNYLLKDLIANKIKESDNLSNLIKEKIELRNIEELIDKTVNGIVEFKDDLMRISDDHYGNKTTTQTNENLRKRLNANCGEIDGNETNGGGGGVDAFLKKEIDAINAAVQQVNVLPAVLSNGHAK